MRGRPRWLLLLAWGCALAALPGAVLPAVAQGAPPVPAAAGPEDEVRERVERIVAEPGFQSAMPEEEGVETEVPSPPPQWPAWLGEVLEVLVWVLLAAGVVAILLALVNAFRARGSGPGRRETPAPSPAVRSPERRDDEPLPDAEALAREGRFGEAVHALLLHALALLARRRGASLQASLTSREVLGRSGLEGEPRQALGELVAAVERFLFAGRPLDGTDWERCRDAFRTLDRETLNAEALGPGAGAAA